MKREAVVLGLTLLIAAPAGAQRGGGHGGGFSGAGRGGGSGGHAAPRAAAAAHLPAARMVTAPPLASASRPAGSSFAAGRFVPAPATPTRSEMQHVPIGTLASRPAFTPLPARVRLTWTAASAMPQRASTTTAPLALAAAPAKPAPRPAVVKALTFPARHPTFFAANVPFPRSTLFVFFGDCFFPFFVETVTFDPFLLNPFCPFCATGRILRSNGVSPFVRRRFFFDGFFPGSFFPAFGPAFGTNVFLGGGPLMAASAEQAPASEEKPGEAGTPAEEAAPASPGAEQRVARPITLLFLKNGWMGGLTDYWVEDGRLHYLTSYGGENSVPLAQIDFDRTVQLNAERGVEFVLRPKPKSR